MPEPREGESKDDFVTRCMGDAEAISDFPDVDRRVAACNGIFETFVTNARNPADEPVWNVKLTAHMSGLVHRKMVDGEEHLVIPAVMALVGVMNDVMFSAEELKKFPDAWNGRPLPVGHPVDGHGNNVSCNTPEILEKTVGQVFNARFFGNKLMCELWINIRKCKEHRPDIIDRLEANEMLEISTAMFIEERTEKGVFAGA